MTTKTLFNPERLSPPTQRAANLDQHYYDKCGVNGDHLAGDPTAKLRQLPGEKVDYGPNGTYIRQGRNRPGDPDSGYARYMGAGSISLCAGPSSSQIQRFKSNTKIQSTLVTEPNKALDAAYIDIDQLNNPDGNENISIGTTVPAIGVSSLVAKADAIRILSRNKLVLATRTGLKKNSHGTDIAHLARS